MANYMGWTDKQWDAAFEWHRERWPDVTVNRDTSGMGFVRAAWQQFKGVRVP